MNKGASQAAKLPVELKKLADAACNGTLTDGQRRRLERLLAQSKSSQLSYLSYLDIHAQLQWEGRCGAEPEHDAAAADAKQRATGQCEIETQVSLLFDADRRRTVRRRIRWTVWVTVATVLVAALGMSLYQFLRQEPSPQELPVATWVRGLDAQWKDTKSGSESAPPAPGAPLRKGNYRLTRGWAEIRFESGAIVTLEAPTQIGLLDVGSARLNSGRLAAEVPPNAAGFTIGTPAGNIIDRGTGFGVQVDDDGETFVQVYEGQVAAELIDGDAHEPDEGDAPRRVWPLTGLRIPGEVAASPQQASFEPLRFVRTRCERPPMGAVVATTARMSLDDNPDATAHVKAFLARVETSPAEVIQLGRVFEGFTEVNDFTTSELRVLIPAALVLLDDERQLAAGAGPSATAVPRRVADRAESLLEFAAGFRPEGEPRSQIWRDWWSRAQPKSRSAWLSERTDILRERLDAWRAGAGYPENLHARNLIEIAVRSRDQQVVPIFMDVLRAEVPVAHKSEVHLAAVVDAVGRLGSPRLVPELVKLARGLNDAQKAVEPKGYSDDHARRSGTLRSFAEAMDRLAGTELTPAAIQVIGPAEMGFGAVDESAFPQWLEAAKVRAGSPQQDSPSDLPKGSAESPRP